MTTPERGNRLLASMPDAEWEELRPHLESVELTSGQVLVNPGDAPQYLYFLLSGIVSLVMTTRQGGSVEVALSGREGLAGAFALLGRNDMPYSLVVQASGRAIRVAASVLRERVDTCGRLHALVLGYIQALITEIAQAVVCNRFHTTRQRLARWLLLTTDRLGSDTLPLTHEWIAQMVGGPRSAITEVIGELRDEGVIEYRRGVLQILDRTRLERASCECYGAISAGHTRFLPS